jgi:hypothetical protein
MHNTIQAIVNKVAAASPRGPFFFTSRRVDAATAVNFSPGGKSRPG